MSEGARLESIDALRQRAGVRVLFRNSDIIVLVAGANAGRPSRD